VGTKFTRVPTIGDGVREKVAMTGGVEGLVAGKLGGTVGAAEVWTGGVYGPTGE